MNIYMRSKNDRALMANLVQNAPDITYIYNHKHSETDLVPLWGCFRAETLHSKSSAASESPLGDL